MLLLLAACANLSKAPDSGLDTGLPLDGDWSGTVQGLVAFSEGQPGAYCSGEVEGRVFSTGLLRAVGTCEIAWGPFEGLTSEVFIEGTTEPVALGVRVPFEGGLRSFEVDVLSGQALGDELTATGDGRYVTGDGNPYPARVELSLVR